MQRRMQYTGWAARATCAGMSGTVSRPDMGSAKWQCEVCGDTLFSCIAYHAKTCFRVAAIPILLGTRGLGFDVC